MDPQAAEPQAAPEPPEEIPGFPIRTLMMPFMPRLWRLAPRLSVLSLLLGLALMALVLYLLVGLTAGSRVSGELKKAAASYDENFDPVVVEDGEVRVEGDRLPQFSEGTMTFLVDPEETVSASEIDTSDYVLVRKTVIHRKQAFQNDTIPVADLQKMLGGETIRIDGEEIEALADEWSGRITLGAGLIVMLIYTVLTLALSPLYALLVATLLMAIQKGKSLGPYWKVGLAVAYPTVVIDVARGLVGLPSPGCFGFALWPALMFGLGWLALRGTGPSAREAP